MIKLYEIKPESRIDVSHLGIRYGKTNKIVKQLNFHHIDGMYSLCTDDHGNIIHLACGTEVKHLYNLNKD